MLLSQPFPVGVHLSTCICPMYWELSESKGQSNSSLCPYTQHPAWAWPWVDLCWLNWTNGVSKDWGAGCSICFREDFLINACSPVLFFHISNRLLHNLHDNTWRVLVLLFIWFYLSDPKHKTIAQAGILFLDWTSLWIQYSTSSGQEGLGWRELSALPGQAHNSSEDRWLPESHSTWPNRDRITQAVSDFSNSATMLYTVSLPKVTLLPPNFDMMPPFSKPSNCLISYLRCLPCFINKTVTDSKTQWVSLISSLLQIPVHRSA